MFDTGAVVTLIDDKTHGEGEASLSIRGGLVGMVMNQGRARDGNHSYVVDFGPEGQWNCFHSELRGEQADGNDDEDWDDILDDDVVEEEVIDDRVELDVPTPEETEERIRIAEARVAVKKEKVQTVDFEKDMKRMSKEIEKGH